MTDLTAASPAASFRFLRDGAREPQTLHWPDGAAVVRKAVGEALNARNVSFLLGAGCSSRRIDGSEVGIPTMLPLAEEFCAAAGRDDPAPAPEEVDERSSAEQTESWALLRSELELLEEFGVSLDDPEYSGNIERLMEALHSLHFIMYRSRHSAHEQKAHQLARIVKRVQCFIWERCTNGAFARGDDHVSSLYEQFYRKLVLRDRSLPRPWIFTTNYDLFNEQAMDRLGLPYTNGFSGVIERRFNPSMFRYALAEQLDVASRKWAAVDGFVYLAKLHGSVSWTEDERGLFTIREQWPSEPKRKVMIYPTPAKQNSSLGSPYADLFREFQAQIVQDQSVLITLGFAFGDEHINNIIYQALTIPTFRLIVFADPDAGGEIAKLRALGDPRIWIIGGSGTTPGSRAHYFDHVVEHFLPQRSSEKIENAIRRVIDTLANARTQSITDDAEDSL